MNSNKSIDIKSYDFLIDKQLMRQSISTDILPMLSFTTNRNLQHEIKGLRKDIDTVLSKLPIYISVKELERTFAISESQQKGLRGRIYNPLPYYQDGEGGKIRYKVSEIDEWMNKQKIKRGI